MQELRGAGGGDGAYRQWAAMTCDVIKFVDGSHAIVCHRGTRAKRCQFCNEHASFECDGPKPKKKSGTCDKRMCESHRTKVRDTVTERVRDTVNHCPDCLGTGEQLGLGL